MPLPWEDDMEEVSMAQRHYAAAGKAALTPLYALTPIYEDHHLR